MATQLIAAPFYCFTLLLKISSLSLFRKVTVTIPYSLRISAFRAFKQLFQKRSCSFKVTRYRMAPLIGFAWNKFVYLGVGVSAIESRGIYPLNHNRVHEYLFSISATSETTTSMNTAPPNMALVCVPSCLVTNSQNVLPISAELPFTALSIVLPSDTSPEEIIAFRLFKETNSVPKIPRKHSTGKTVSLSYLPFTKLIISRKSE